MAAGVWGPGMYAWADLIGKGSCFGMLYLEV